MEKTWKTVKGFEKYEVCLETQEFRNKRTKHVLAPIFGKRGQKLVCLFDDGPWPIQFQRTVEKLHHETFDIPYKRKVYK